MGRLLLVWGMLGLFWPLAGQTADDVGRVALSVVMPENVDGLDASQLSKLQTKITQIVTSAGLAATGYDQNFVIYPRFAIYEDNVVEGGMQSIHVVKAELGLFIEQVESGILFSSATYPLTGSGEDLHGGITNAISKISVRSPDLLAFVAEGKQKILAYYAERCDDIIAQADMLVKADRFQQALAELLTIPEELEPCYQRIQDKVVYVYNAYQAQRCAELMQDARAFYSGLKYTEALNVLADVDPTSNCAGESKTLMANIQAKMAEDQRRALAAQKPPTTSQNSSSPSKKPTAQKTPIKGAKEVAYSYYSAQPRKTTYKLIKKK